MIISLATVAGLSAPLRGVSGQSSVLDRVRKAAQGAAHAGTKAVTDEANRQINSAVLDAAAEDVADGSFVAVLSPWSTDNTRSVQVARYAGNAFVVTTATGRQIIICDPKSVISWQTTFTILNAAVGTPTKASLGTGKTAGATTAGRSGGATTATAGRGSSPPATTGPAAAGAGTAKAPPAPSLDEREYRLPAPTVTIALPATGPKSGAPSQGSIIVGNVSQEVLAGTAKVRFAKATVPGETGPQVVDFGVAFKAMVLAPGTAPSGCMAPATAGAKPATVARGAAPTAASATPTRTAAAAPPAPAANTTAAPAPAFAEGDVLVPKIDNVKLLAAANDSAKVSVTLKTTDEVVFLGDEQNGYLHVQGSNGEGWARKALLKKK
jgi:hypothetical protein